MVNSPPPSLPAPTGGDPAAAAPAVDGAPPPRAAVKSSYEPPAWAALPSAAYFLEMIKDGVVVEKIEISSRPHFVIGRHPSTADIVVAHPSVSRAHAVVQHRDTGEVYFYDMGSTHGSTVNRKPAPPRAYVALRIGAVVRLGQSTRTICLMGESDPARENPQEAQQALQEQRAAQAQVRAQARAERIARQTGRSMVQAEDIHARGAGWGFDDEADAEEGEAVEAEDSSLETMSFEGLHAQAKAKGLHVSQKQQRLVEQLEKRSAKLSNLSSEIERIAAKQLDGLSDGQSSHLERTKARATELSGQITSLKAELAETLREQLGTRRQIEEGGSGRRKRPAPGGDDDDGDDDFFDRTVRPAKSAARGSGGGAREAGGGAHEASGVAESEPSLRAKLASVREERASVVRAQDVLSVERAAAEAETAKADPLEAYMHQNTAQVLAGRARALAARREEMDGEEARLLKLLAFVAPALQPSTGAEGAAGAGAAPVADGGADCNDATPSDSTVPPAAKRGRASEPPPAATVRTAATPQASSGGEAAAAEAPAPATDVTAARPRAASERFRQEFAEAVSRRQRGGGDGGDEGGDEGGGEAATAAIAEAGRSAAGSEHGPPSAVDEEGTEPRRGGLGFGSSKPDASRVAEVKQSYVANKAHAQAQEEAMRPGLNRGGCAAAGATAGARPGAGPGAGAAPRPRQGPAIGPAMPPPQPRAARQAQAQRAALPAASGETDEFEWTAPRGQTGDGKTALNAKLGY